jgi:Zn-dependent protease with chaperone function
MGSFSVLGFVRAWLLPALLLFALPAFALWFTRHAERTYDARILAVVLPQVDADAALSPDERASAHQFYENAPPSVACASSGDELAHYRENLGETCDDYDQFRAAKSAALAALAIGGFAVLFALGSALLAFVSRPAQYVSLWLGWNVLKVVGALETVLQGGLLVWLSFWMMALWMERYSVKLILVAGGLAAVAAFAVLRAIFQRPASGLDVEGEPLPASAAPELWARIGQLAAELGTSPPDHIVVGIDDNFFVTQSEVRVAGTSLRGRTLYISLSLLRTLAGDEAEAVLAHELAHLLGGDTGHGQKLAPLSARFVQYLTVLHGGITRPIYYFMNAYFALFQLSVGRSRRRAEFAADAAAARVTTAGAWRRRCSSTTRPTQTWASRRAWARASPATRAPSACSST